MTELVKWFVKNPVAANLIMLVIFGLGILGYINVGKTAMPSAAMDVINVSVPYLGAGPKEVEDRIVIRLEEAVFDIRGIKRLTGRRVAPKSGRIYNVYFDKYKPKQEGVCDESGEALVQRKDDTEETVLNRLDVYEKLTSTLIDYYKEKDLLHTISGDVEVQEAQPEIFKLMDAIAA